MAKKKLSSSEPEDVVMLCVRVPKRRHREIKAYSLGTGYSIQQLIQWWVACGLKKKLTPQP